MSKQIIIAEQHRIAAVFSEDQIQELIVATGSHQVSDIYLGIVENVLPGIDAAFVNIGDSERNGFIHVSDLGPLRLKRAAAPITELLVPQQKVLVQIMKEPTGNKGPRLTGNITLPGRYLVLMPFGRGVNLSRRIRNENERNRLRALAILVKPAGMGLLVRTEAESVPEEAIIEDLEALQRQWETIQQEALTSRAPSLLNRDDDFIQKVLRDVHSAEVNRIVVDSPNGTKRVKQHLLNWSGGKAPQGVLIDHHREKAPILEYFRVNAAIREALKPRVDLPSGGYIIIERTEALTVIDVNSGSFTRSATARETVLWTNCEAAAEIARQLRLRNIAGVIVVDFIDMDSHRDKLQVLEQFTKALRADKARPQVAQLTELGLVELTRKRQGQNIYELFGRPCPTCGGMGHLVHLPSESDDVVHALDTGGSGRSIAPPREVTPAEPRIIPREPRESWDSGVDYGSDGMAEPLAASLISHPSYQDRGKGDRRRRRGRPARNGDSIPRPVLGGGRPLELAPSLPEPVSPLDDIAPELPAPPIERERVVKEPRPERGRGRREKPPAEPPEVVMVEMTAEEQELYAMMGISPLVLAPDTVKNPKSAVVSVYLPGMAPATAPTVSVMNDTEGDDDSYNYRGAVALADEDNGWEPGPVTPEPVRLPEPAADSEASDASEQNGAPNRRRRRRSSASGGSDD
ncbi:MULTISPECIES: Rne/Rng family ribonuclease [unclassified Leptolyngbya]|uniref:Rne/Rng family ribonuclease n=1 Tax=unclassified Leptolyngbya TaxID=2650499 RepID=UPI001689607D|nr:MULTISPECIES: Rne/Rng family ribonuclease [unclassified Leptolyngbya]MBD1912339.1 ribonuclease E/G [Leptolyngbya sp. FACHB-8]MBD2158025.1 ribonuclease E/G [Leptolyngbya sp. FACHB-16]